MIQVNTIQPNELNNENESSLRSLVAHLYLNDEMAITDLIEVTNLTNGIRDIYQRSLRGNNIRKEMTSRVYTIKELTELAGVLILGLKERMCNV